MKQDIWTKCRELLYISTNCHSEMFSFSLFYFLPLSKYLAKAMATRRYKFMIPDYFSKNMYLVFFQKI